MCGARAFCIQVREGWSSPPCRPAGREDGTRKCPEHDVCSSLSPGPRGCVRPLSGPPPALSIAQEQQEQCCSLGHSPEQGQLSWRGLNELPVWVLATYILPFGGGGGLPSPGKPAQLWLAQAAWAESPDPLPRSQQPKARPSWSTEPSDQPTPHCLASP